MLYLYILKEEGVCNVTSTLKNMANHSIEIPESSEFFTPLFATIPLQLLSYHIALLRECNVDQPRNLAKSVTVE